MGIIKQLSDKVSNVIAAGEVIERPFNVVKELVENSIDALSTEITVHLKDSGMQSIRVIDNGIGMDKDDALLCFSRHATSKIDNEQDLFRILTLGFRGEAMPTIASVSEMTLHTSKGEEGYFVSYAAGDLIEHNYAKARKGTEITVNNLFYNTPARLKYIRSLTTEISKITEYIDHMSLAYPHIKFTLTNNDKVISKTIGNNDILPIIGNIYGLDAAKGLLHTKYKGNAFDLNIHFCKPFLNRSNRNSVKFIVNGRFIQNQKLFTAVCEAFHTYIDDKKYPIAIIVMNIDPILIDVNVHPSKIEVRFANEADLIEGIKKSIREKLEENNHIPEVKLIKEEPIIYKQEEITFNTYVKPVERVVERPVLKIEEPIKEEVITNRVETNLSKNFNLNNEYKIPYLNYLGRYNRTYVIAQDNEYLYLIDQHAAQERVNYEYYINKLSNVTDASYPLLIPINIDFTKSEAMLIEENLEYFKQIGLVLEESGISSFYIREIPIWFVKGYEKETVDMILSQFLELKSIDIRKFRDKYAASLACKGSIRANEDINNMDVFALLDNLRKCDNPYTCPHGRPTIIKFSSTDIEKMFKRIV